MSPSLASALVLQSKGADAVCIGTLFAVAQESELTTEEKIAFAESTILPYTSKDSAKVFKKNPDGTTVRIGDSSR